MGSSIYIVKPPLLNMQSISVRIRKRVQMGSNIYIVKPPPLDMQSEYWLIYSQPPFFPLIDANADSRYYHHPCALNALKTHFNPINATIPPITPRK